MKFIDLFSGLGGFHLALARSGHKCVFACEIDEHLRALYATNFGINPEGDIRALKIDSIPKHDILCAGFPCQPFSKAGDQKGLECPRWGDLIDYVTEVIRRHKPKYFILENVPNLLKHDDGTTWPAIRKRLACNGFYRVDARILSPHQFGIPQIRHRVFIVGWKTGTSNFRWPEPTHKSEPSVQTVLDRDPSGSKKLGTQLVKCFSVWQDFLSKFPESEPLPAFPIWSMEFGARYTYKTRTPYAKEKAQLPAGIRRGHTGPATIGRKKRFQSLPSYARVRQEQFPQWKVQFIRQNRRLYRRHKEWIDPWLSKIRKFPPSLQKLEWNCNNSQRNIWNYLVQVRASGVRVKKRTSAPSLVAMTTTQVPIIAWEKRYMTPRECARLQSMTGLRNLPNASSRAFKALGNAVNARLVELIVRNLLNANTTKTRRQKQSRSKKQHAIPKRQAN
jgi:DNA (cytosine-5)-methyltransferase 1